MSGASTALAEAMFLTAATPGDGLRAASILFDAVPPALGYAADTVSGVMRKGNRDIVADTMQTMAYGLAVKSAVAMTYGNTDELG